MGPGEAGLIRCLGIAGMETAIRRKTEIDELIHHDGAQIMF